MPSFESADLAAQLRALDAEVAEMREALDALAGDLCATRAELVTTEQALARLRQVSCEAVADLAAGLGALRKRVEGLELARGVAGEGPAQ